MKYNCRSLLVSFFFLIIFPTQYLWGYETSKTEEKTIPFHPGGKIVLKVNDGDVHIRTWERNEVVIRMTKHAWSSSRHKAEKRLQDLRVEIREDEDLLTIRELHRNDNFMIFDLFSNDFWQGQWHKKQIDFELDVPRQTNIQIDIDDGDIQIEGIEGKLWIESDAGNINAHDFKSERIEIETDEGNIYLSHFQGLEQESTRLSCIADEGRIRIKNASIKHLLIHSDEGNVYLGNVAVKEAQISCDEGDLDADLKFLPESHCRTNNNEGDVLVVIPADASLQVTLRSKEGFVTSDFELKKRKRAGGVELKNAVGSGAGKLIITTDEGDIRLEKK